MVQSCAANARHVLPAGLLAALAAGGDSPEAGRRLSHSEEKSLLPPLLRLRQACCHPQVSGASVPCWWLCCPS